MNKELPYIREWLDRRDTQANAVPSSRNEVNGTRISGKNCAMHW
ncbi:MULTISPECIES: hypothetical protein [Paenibacillus]|uniref:Uncharacterized protein n=1 Tax=Paenibacillus peoriae TaxID=59893 RepID=A0ABU1QBN2_9BACL|nr:MULTISPECIES: hypothetical protein [Paenibacillus]MDR6777043.1 hypothetical protein [Paenibacillus peoriae]